MKSKPINPQRLRRIPKQFSWIDQRLVRQGYLQRCDHRALSLYLFYLTVADAQGMSYYADARLMSALSMTQHQLTSARHCLMTTGLIAYAKPFIQVLSLEASVAVESTAARAVPTLFVDQAARVQPKPSPQSIPNETSIKKLTRQESAAFFIHVLQEQLRKPQ